MANNSSLSDVFAQQLNPLTPMAFLPPDIGYQSTIAAYIMVGTVGALIWDILTNVDSDYKLLFRHKISIPTGTYFLSRASVLVYVLVNVIFQTAALPNCHVIKKTVCVLYHVAFSSTSLLFFLRVRAIFNQNRFAVAFFFLLWLGVLGGSLTVATVGNAIHLGPTDYCKATAIKLYASAAPITFAVNDTFVFLAISWRLLMNAPLDPDHKAGFNHVVLGKYLPAFSRALLQDGQVYYLVSVTSNIIVVSLTWAHTVPLAYKLMFTVFNVALTNMMACRVYRHTKFGDFREDAISTRRIASQLGRLDLQGGLAGQGMQFAPHSVNVNSQRSSSDGTRTHKVTIGDVEAVQPRSTEKLQLTRTKGTDADSEV
ncbi:hypothetical protein Hypma_002096 [Hypsizygus marmoreus]|uniref:Uncharacterized protein n=1 Tax=Hypsizygus marmoreus TaxID=39966 RepID=A0A369K879_HYPMA|nr:hypothetical protein Hypma_002096 [Hypsizygus marmoreus]